MTVAPGTVLAQSYDNVDRTLYTTASSTPTAGRIVYIAVEGRRATAPGTPAISGTGWASGTWTKRDDQNQGAQQNITVWWILCPASPSAGVVTIDYGVTTMTGCAWVLFDVTGQNLTTPVPQSNKAQGSGTLGSLLLAAPIAGSAMFAAFGHAANEGVTLDGSGGWSQVGSTQAGVTPNVSLAVEYNSAADAASIQMSWVSAVGWAGIAWEAAAVVVAPTNVDLVGAIPF